MIYVVLCINLKVFRPTCYDLVNNLNSLAYIDNSNLFSILDRKYIPLVHRVSEYAVVKI